MLYICYRRSVVSTIFYQHIDINEHYDAGNQISLP